ncbi:hypothetical protein FACS1894193_11470 [Bacilli bacterium]|nr:hypothetical protein FACS1894192_04210 [Bacilli bacterium]GHU43892.1 hypothetical protein FACS1894193_11470 [Bacilli bacterium]
MKKILLMGLLALSMCLSGSVEKVNAADATSGATVTVSDHNGIAWTADNKVPIFSNSVFYPGYKEDYWFTIKNTNSHEIDYKMVFDLDDQSGVPLNIKVSRDQEVLFNHQTKNNVVEETIESDVLKIPAGATYSYHFHLDWNDASLTDAEDTAHGLAAMDKDKVTSVNFYFEKDDAKKETHLPTTSNGNTQAIGQTLPTTLGSLPTTLGKFGEKNPVLASALGGIVILIIGLILWKRRKADEEN